MPRAHRLPIIYLGGVLTAVAVGAVGTYKVVNNIASAPQNIIKLETQLDVATEKILKLEQRISAIEGADFVTFGQPLSIRDTRQPAVMVTRHGKDGNFLNAYPEGKEGLGVYASTVWVFSRPR